MSERGGRPTRVDREVLPLGVGTDPGPALKTRKGTGYYKVPSRKGAWYRGRYLHDGSFTSLEEMFDPARTVKGRAFGLRLPAEERSALLAFLKTL